MGSFRLWLESRIDRETAKRIVLDAVGAGEVNGASQQDVLGSLLSEQPRLVHNLSNYSILKPHMDVILNFIQTHQQSNLIDLINYLQQLDGE